MTDRENRNPNTDEPEELEYDEQRNLNFYGSDSDFYVGDHARRHDEKHTPLDPVEESEPEDDMDGANTTEEGALIGRLLADPKLLADVLEGLHDGDTSRVHIALPWKFSEDPELWHRYDGRTRDILMEVSWQRRGVYTAMNHSYWGRGIYGEFDTQEEAILHANNVLRQRGYILTGPELPND